MTPMRWRIPFLPDPPRVVVIQLRGRIAARGRGLSDFALAPAIERAFTRFRPAAVALVIDSPGGSPVQSSLIAARIRRLADAHRVPVHAFVEDIAASGGYWLACAADHIWVDASSIVGSIGVIHAGFGFQDLIARHGVERRVLTAGRAKAMGDPFRAQTDEDIARMNAMLAALHRNFIAQVRARRGGRLKPGADLFNADVWIGEEAVAMGLADGVAHLKPYMQALFGEGVRLVAVGPRRALAERLGLGPGLVDAVAGTLEERALYAGYGL